MMMKSWMYRCTYCRHQHVECVGSCQRRQPDDLYPPCCEAAASASDPELKVGILDEERQRDASRRTVVLYVFVVLARRRR
jgi:hypothetical protein